MADFYEPAPLLLTEEMIVLPQLELTADMIALSIHRNPFWLLGATMRDNVTRINELADEKALLLDEELCQKARSDLTTPRTRIVAEVDWLPGLSPGRAMALIAEIERNPLQAAELTGLPVLAQVNLMASAFQAQGYASGDFAKLHHTKAAPFILKFAHLVESISPEEVLRDINEDRAISGFPTIQGTNWVEAELAELRLKHRDMIKDALNRMPPAVLVDTMAVVVRTDTDNGEILGTAFVDELVDIYQAETKPFLERELDKVVKSIDFIKKNADQGEEAVKLVLDEVEKVLRAWVKVAEPCRISWSARGIRNEIDEISEQMAYLIRGAAIDICNEHDFIYQAQRITELLQELFPYVPEVAVRLKEDADAIRSIVQGRAKAAKEKAEWANDITYSTEIGLIFKDKLSISPEGVEWKGRRIPLDRVTRVRWGAIKHYVNGVPTGTNYTIGVGDDSSELAIGMKDGGKYSTFIDRLWQAVCIRLMGVLLVSLKQGKKLTFGDALVDDLGVTLVRHKFFGSNEPVYCNWSKIKIWSASGSLFIGSVDDKNVYSTMSYMGTPNVHLLHHLISLKFKNRGQRLSDLLN